MRAIRAARAMLPWGVMRALRARSAVLFAASVLIACGSNAAPNASEREPTTTATASETASPSPTETASPIATVALPVNPNVAAETIATATADCVLAGAAHFVGDGDGEQRLWVCPADPLRVVVEDGASVVYTTESATDGTTVEGELESARVLDLTPSDRPDVMLSFAVCTGTRDLLLLTWTGEQVDWSWEGIADHTDCEGEGGYDDPAEDGWPVYITTIPDPHFELTGDQVTWNDTPAVWLDAEGFVPTDEARAAWQAHRVERARSELAAGHADIAACWLDDQTPDDLVAQVEDACVQQFLAAIDRAAVVPIDPAWDVGDAPALARAQWRVSLAIRGLRCDPSDAAMIAAHANARDEEIAERARAEAAARAEIERAPIAVEPSP
jgi:hypothetical protein